MAQIIDWLMQPNNGRLFVLLLFFTTYVGILIYVFTGKKRTEQLESYKDIPFQDEDDNASERKEQK